LFVAFKLSVCRRKSKSTFVGYLKLILGSGLFFNPSRRITR
jgi:hypothetical protein